MAFDFAHLTPLCQARVLDFLEDHIMRQQDISTLKKAFLAFVCGRRAIIVDDSVRGEWKRRLLCCRDFCRTVPTKSRTSAVRSSIYAYGAENVYVNSFLCNQRDPPFWERSHGYYRRIPYEIVDSNDARRDTEEHEITVRFPIVCDTLNNVDLVVHDATRAHSLGDLVRCVSTPYDSFFVDDVDPSLLERFINVNNRLLADKNSDRSVRKSGDKWIVPLLMCPFHDNDVAYPLMCRPPTLTLTTKRSGGVDFELWGYMYYLDTEHKVCGKYQIPPIEYMSTVLYGPRSYVLKRGENVIPLRLVNPVTQIFFFGPDPRHVRDDVQLRINGRTEISMSIDMLEEEKRRRGLQDVDAWVLFFCRSRHCDRKSNADVLNFSRVDNAQLVIHTTDDFPDERNSAPLHVSAHAMELMRFYNKELWTDKHDYETRLSTRSMFAFGM